MRMLSGATALKNMRMLSGAAALTSANSMYNWRVQGVLNALERAGKAEGPLEVEDLTALGHLDQYHYLGTWACDHAAELLDLKPTSTLLDVGSGIGGPARYLSARTGCSVVGVELQPDLSQAASKLTARVRGVSKRVSFITGDITDPALRMPADFDSADAFDHFMSLLVNLHVPGRGALLRTCFERLKPGGTFYIEDFVASAPLLAEESATLLDVVKAPSVTSVAEYLRELRDGGFVDLEAVDMSAPWTAWTKARAELYAASEAETVALHGRDHFKSRVSFYEDIDRLFAGGRVGGVRITGRKPGAHEVALLAGRLSLANRHAGPGGGVGAAKADDTRASAAARAMISVLEGGAGTVQDHEATTALAAAAASGVSSAASAVSSATAGGGVLPAHGVSATQHSSAQLLVGAANTQPPLPWRDDSPAGLHDSLQYHFFFPGLFVATRVFHTASLQHHSSWAYCFARPDLGPIELHNSSVPLASVPSAPLAGSRAALVLSGDEMHIQDANEGGLLLQLRPARADASAALREVGGVADGACGRPELTIRAGGGHAFGWMPAGFESEADRPVIHRPDLRATVTWAGAELGGFGYCKRYHGIYPRHNGWRFIHGVAASGATAAEDATRGIAPRPSSEGAVAVVWTADATFGDDKYNYYKLMPDAKAGGGLLQADAADTYNQADAGYAMINGERHSATLKELAKWHTIIGGGGGGQMESKYENRLGVLTLRCGKGPALTGLAYNERCFGTLW